MQVHKVYFVIAVSIALIGLLALSVWAPWQQISPDDRHHVISLPRAPVWSHSDMPGAAVDLHLYVLDVVIILALAGVIAKMGSATRTRLQPPKS